MPYVIIVEDDNSLYGSQKCEIMQREKLFNKLWFLVPPYYNGYDMSKCTVTMRFLRPISKEFEMETLVLSDERYKDYLKYVLPIDTNLSKEFGDLELNLTFTMVDIDENGNVVQHVRKTKNHILHITQLSDWDSIIPDRALLALDQRILKQDAQIKALSELVISVNGNKVDNLVYNEVEDTLQLMAGGVGVGDKVSVRDMLDDGAPVVDFNSDIENNPSDDNESTEESNVVEF